MSNDISLDILWLSALLSMLKSAGGSLLCHQEHHLRSCLRRRDIIEHIAAVCAATDLDTSRRELSVPSKASLKLVIDNAFKPSEVIANRHDSATESET